jgi:hypothetical protein
MRWVLSESWQATISCFLQPCYKLPSIVFLADDTYGVPCRPYRGADFFYARLQSLRYCTCSPKSTFLRRTLLCTSREVFLILSCRNRGSQKTRARSECGKQASHFRVFHRHRAHESSPLPPPRPRAALERRNQLPTRTSLASRSTAMTRPVRRSTPSHGERRSRTAPPTQAGPRR